MNEKENLHEVEKYTYIAAIKSSGFEISILVPETTM